MPRQALGAFLGDLQLLILQAQTPVWPVWVWPEVAAWAARARAQAASEPLKAAAAARQLAAFAAGRCIRHVCHWASSDSFLAGTIDPIGLSNNHSRRAL